MASLTEVRTVIRDIDRRIDANRKQGLPGRHERECELFLQRGTAQLVRAQLEAAALKPKPMRRLPKCPACKGSGYAKLVSA